MPHYEYQCQKCQREFSLVMSLAEHDKAKPNCPKCGSRQVDQQISQFQAITSKKS